MIPGKEILFGKIALREGLISSLQLNDALSLQEFRGAFMPLGEILIEQGALSRAQVDFVLDLQREYLASAPNRATLEDCQGLLFGTIAVLHNFCTEAQLHDALRVQATVERYIPVSLGEILVKLGLLSNEQIEKILTLQKRAIFFCESCDVIFNYPCQEIDDAEIGPRCLDCGRPLKASRPSISRRYTIVERPLPVTGAPENPVADALLVVSPNDGNGNGNGNGREANGNGSSSGSSGETSSYRTIAGAHRLDPGDLDAAISAVRDESNRVLPLKRRTTPSLLRATAIPVAHPDGAAPPISPESSDESAFEDVSDLTAPATANGLPEIRVVEPTDDTAPSFPTPPDLVGGAGAAQGGRLGNYMVLRELGRGGMGVVYHARHIRDTAAHYAIKFIRKDLSRNELYLRRFQREISLVLSLNHPNIVETFETGVKDGFHYLVMEYVAGENLGDVLEREGRLPVSRAVNIVRQTAMALASAHRQGVVHRDMKPDNIIILAPKTAPPHADTTPHSKLHSEAGFEFGAASGRREAVKITDFGLAKDLTGFDDNLTVTGQLIGTPHYMSPEQCRGDYSDQRSDIYSLGCTFFHLVTGRPPILGDNSLAVMEQQKNKPIDLPHEINPSVPESISFIIGKMMEKDPNSRYPTMDLLLSHLELWDSDKLVDEISRYAPTFSRVKAFGRRDEFASAAKSRQMQIDFEAELRAQRAENAHLRIRLDRFENFIARWRKTRLLLVVLTGLFTLLGVAVGAILGRLL